MVKQLLEQASHQVDHKPHSHTIRKIMLDWRDGGKTSYEMSREAAAVDGNVAYFMNCNGKMCSYDSSSKTWRVLRRCPHIYGSLAIINGQLTSIGGSTGLEDTNKLLSLHAQTH